MGLPIKERLESLDILRGLDLFMLVGFQSVFLQLARATDEGSWLRCVSDTLFTHVSWEGYHLWDQVMPLFLFMAGTSIPYAMARYKSGKERISSRLVGRVVKRVILLWIFGAIIQGNLLDLNPQTLYLYSNTLQSIAAGYLFSVIFFLCLPIRGVLAVCLLLPAIYTTGMLLTGGYAPVDNLAESIDRQVLGRFMDGATVSETGEVIFADWYHYSWIYSTLNFTTTVLSGVLTGYVLKSDYPVRRKLQRLLTGAIVCFLLAGALSCVEPIIKQLWTSSMTFLSSGISISLMTLSYYWVDVRKHGKGLRWLKIYGMNSILAYMLFFTLDTTSLRDFWLHGFSRLLGDYYPVLFELAHVGIIFCILLLCYRRGVFLKV